jgi:SAM-dependent methyltransferase
VTRFLLRREIIIQPGMETRDPLAAVDRYEKILADHNITFSGKRIMDFGYGGNFNIGVELLRRGAEHVILCDKYAPPDDSRNRTLLPQYQQWLTENDGKVLPKPEQMTLLQADICDVDTLEPVDIILSSSVYEHLDDVDGITAALVRHMKPGGVSLNFIDLRDHYFKLPFEMLSYSPEVWKRWLNPTSNLNRFRVWDYRGVFSKAFSRVEILITGSDEDAYRDADGRIRSEFRSGDEKENAATSIMVYAVK